MGIEYFQEGVLKVFETTNTPDVCKNRDKYTFGRKVKDKDKAQVS